MNKWIPPYIEWCTFHLVSTRTEPLESRQSVSHTSWCMNAVLLKWMLIHFSVFQPTKQARGKITQSRHVSLLYSTPFGATFCLIVGSFYVYNNNDFDSDKLFGCQPCFFYKTKNTWKRRKSVETVIDKVSLMRWRVFSIFSGSGIFEQFLAKTPDG